MFADYTELKDEVLAWLARAPTPGTRAFDRIPSLIYLAEAQMSKDLRVRQTERRATAILNEPFEFLPTDFRTLRVVNNYTKADERVIECRSFDYKQLRREYGLKIGEPEAYALVGNEIAFAPGPDPRLVLSEDPTQEEIDYAADHTGSFELVYYGNVPNLTDEEPTNLILEAFPNIYLYATLAQSAPFLMADERLPIWTSAYTAAVATANEEHDRSVGSQAAMTNEMNIV